MNACIEDSPVSGRHLEVHMERSELFGYTAGSSRGCAGNRKASFRRESGSKIHPLNLTAKRNHLANNDNCGRLDAFGAVRNLRQGLDAAVLNEIGSAGYERNRR